MTTKKTETQEKVEKKAEEVKKTIADKTDEVKETASDVASGVVETAKEKKDEVAEAAKQAVGAVDTEPIQEKIDAAQAKVAETTKNIGDAVKEGFAGHGIDTEKLGAALAEDAKNAAGAVVGGAKFVGSKVADFVEDMKEKAEKKDDTPDTDAPADKPEEK